MADLKTFVIVLMLIWKDFILKYCMLHTVSMFTVSLVEHSPDQIKSSLFVAHFMYKIIQSALHKIKALQRGAEEALKICKRI